MTIDFDPNQPDGASGVFPIWPDVAPGSEHWTWSERTIDAPGRNPPNRMARNVALPTLTRFQPERPNGTAIIVAPGGAFHYLMMDHEGCEVARWLAGLGVTAFVLKYRVQRTPDSDDDLHGFMEQLGRDLPQPDHLEIDPPTGHPGRLWGEADARQSIRYLRTQAGTLGIDPGRIGIMGFSAGGGIAINAALEFDAMSRPDFVGGIYAGYRLGPVVPVDAPPLFLAIADDDEPVAPISSARLYEAWHKARRPVELHIFGSGGHGFGFNRLDLLSDSWTDLFRKWLAAGGWLTAPTEKENAKT